MAYIPFEERPQFLKGKFGEDIIHQYLRDKGFVVYTPNSGCAHGFDNLAVRNKREVIIAECKTKARRNKYPDTGINIKHMDEYLFIQEKHKIPVFIFFIDEGMWKIYGNFLSLLMQETSIEWNGRLIDYPWKQYGIVYFPLNNMREIGKLNLGQVTYLREQSCRNYSYEIEKPEAVTSGSRMACTREGADRPHHATA